MSKPNVKFNLKDQPEFFKELNNRVNQYFKQNNISKHANWNMRIKTAFMICLYFIPFGFLLFGSITTVWLVLLLWVLMGFGMAGIGLSIMHDANHGSYSKNKRVNNILGYLIHFIGGYQENWKIQHNVLHHSFTNVDGYDEDIKNGTLRLSPNQKRLGIHRFQVYYAPMLYSLMTMYWSITKDFEQVVRYKKKDLLSTQGLSFAKAMTEVTFNKIWYFALTLVLPLILVPVAWWIVLIGYLTMHLICGLILALIFQPAHVIEETEFYVPDATGSVENNWAIHQIRTTANFANNSRWFSWLIGGLNFQIEHHLFPNICHVHYKNIAKIVRETTAEFNLPYYQHKTFFGALRSHFSLLNALGTGKYDKRLTTVPV